MIEAKSVLRFDRRTPASLSGDDGGSRLGLRPGDLLSCEIVGRANGEFRVVFSQQECQVEAMLPATRKTLLKVGDRMMATYVGFYRGQEVVFSLDPTLV